MNNKTNKGYVYILSNGEHIKIGFVYKKESQTAENLINKRIKQLQTGSSNIIKLLYYEEGSMDLEWAYHKKYESERVSGEWFKSNLILKEIKRKQLEMQMQKELGYIK